MGVGLGAAGAAVQSCCVEPPHPPRTGQNTGLRVGALARGLGLLCRQGSGIWAGTGAMMPAGEQRSASPGHLPVVPGEETRSLLLPLLTRLPLWDPHSQEGFPSNPTLPPGGSERMVVQSLPRQGVCG